MASPMALAEDGKMKRKMRRRKRRRRRESSGAAEGIPN
jgi:hypothetical protein